MSDERVVVVRRPFGGSATTDSFVPLHWALTGDAIEFVGDSATGCRVSVRIPAHLLADVPSSEPPGDMAERARQAEDRVVAAALARSLLGVAP